MASRSLDYYLGLPYRFEIHPEEDGSGYTATIPDLPGCITSADSIDELIPMLNEAKELWLEIALEDGDYIPEPNPVEEAKYSGRFVARLPQYLHRQIALRANLEGTSLNQLVVAILAEGMGRWTARKEDAETHAISRTTYISNLGEVIVALPAVRTWLSMAPDSESDWRQTAKSRDRFTEAVVRARRTSSKPGVKIHA